MSLATQPGSTDLLLPTAEPGDGTHPYTVHTYYFGFTIPEAQIGAYLYFRAQPAFGLCQGGPVIFRGLDNTELLDAEYHDYRATMPWPVITGTTITIDNGYVISWPEPGRLARLRYRSPDGAVSFELEQRAITPLLARGHIVPGEDDHHSGADREPGGSEQFMHVTGQLDLRGERLDIDCLHVRDRSWNQIRTEVPGGARPHPPLGWTPICFGEDLALQTTSYEPEDSDPAWKGLYRLPDGAEPFFNSWVVRKGEPRQLVSVRRTVHRYHPVLHSAIEQELEAIDDTGERYHFHGEALAQTPMHSWPNIAFRDSVFRWRDVMNNRVAHCTYQEICYDAYIRGHAMRPEDYVLALEDCATAAAGVVGGKALGLGKLLAFGLPVPPGFVVTADAYRACIAAAGLGNQIAGILATVTDAHQARAASDAIGGLFTDRLLDGALADEIAGRYQGLGVDADLPVAVRSSATAEDLADASFAGQQDTYLWICGAENVKRHIVRCWASLFTPRAIQYRARLAVAPEDLAMAVVVQQMVPAAAAGVMMTLEPVSGDRETIYLEGTYGLGEGVVRGDVGVDRYWVDKTAHRVRRADVATKSQAHRVDERGVVALADVEAALRDEPCMSDDEVRAVAALGRQVEQAFGAPMDIEWAIDDSRKVHLVQARPETVWSNRPDVEDPNPLHEGGPPDAHWTTTNVGEAMPGVLTPLSWSVWRPTGSALAELAYAVGVLSDAERRTWRAPDAQPMRIFYGRAAFQLEFFAMLGDRLPGTSGPEAAKSLLGRIPEDLSYRPTRKRYPSVAWRFPATFIKVPRQVRVATADTAAWYRRAIDSCPGLDRPGAVELLLESRRRLVRLVTLQTIAVIGGLQPVYDALEKLVGRTGVGDVATLSGGGGAEMLGVVGDLWKVSRGQLDLDAVVREHGFHGPMEGELSATVWREDPAPLQRMVTEYARRPASDDPLARERARHEEALQLRPALLAALPAVQRPLARVVLALAVRRLPLRGVVKVSLLQAFDVARAAARHIGVQLAADGLLHNPDDVFYLTVDELTGSLPTDAKVLVRRRQERREAYQRIDLPSDWSGTPRPTPLERDTELDSDAVLSGIGVSAGTVEGPVRVVTDPSQELEADEILVAPTTDPSWSSIMFVSKALVVDIGGALSHAAVVARELGIPCVVNTRTGTRSLRTGDRVRVDGAAGTVEVLERTAETPKEVAGAGQ